MRNALWIRPIERNLTSQEFDLAQKIHGVEHARYGSCERIQDGDTFFEDRVNGLGTHAFRLQNDHTLHQTTANDVTSRYTYVFFFRFS